jgi:hypothetical protein
MPIAFPTTGLTDGQEYSPPGITGVKYTYNAAKQVWVGAAASSSSSSYTLTPATSLALGGVKVGTGLNVQPDGTLSSAVGSLSSLAPNGYMYIGGLLMQWGYEAAIPIDKHTAVTFPRAFSTAVVSVVASLVNTLAPDAYWTINNIIQVGAVTNAGFHIINNKAYNNDPDLPGYWLALGY